MVVYWAGGLTWLYLLLRYPRTWVWDGWVGDFFYGFERGREDSERTTSPYPVCGVGAGTIYLYIFVHWVLVGYWLVVGVVFIFGEGGFSENYLSLSLINFIVDYTGTQHTYSCGRGSFLKNTLVFCLLCEREDSQRTTSPFPVGFHWFWGVIFMLCYVS